ncbi:MAG: tRNA (N6-isopentenyl adenosine(37)-C2)-methylthiotransferase MiaB [Polyangiaceae bacterium]|nr:tRNA (N6-isopentenyl adenosine(37)-C2)-methylthiotransferase MiaB [Polyangiaceae bacterium]
MTRFVVVTFGCQMNEHDSERMAEVLRDAGYERTDRPSAADIVIVNTCSVRDKAEQKLLSELGRLSKLKRTRPDLALVVAGCVAQQHGKRLLARVPALDLVVGPDHIAELPELLRQIELGGPPQAHTGFDLDEPRFLSARPGRAGAAPSAYVTVMKGCNERCSFCIVPHTRGPERYRPSREIVDEVARLVSAGTREITLLGQTVNSYVDPGAGQLGAASAEPASGWRHHPPSQARRDQSQFAELLRLIAREVPGLWRLRYASPHPRYLTAPLIVAHAELPVLARHVHLPVQSGSDRVLRRMIRRHSVAEYLERTDALRAAVADLSLSTDIIVGFPGETRADFQKTLRLVERVGFTGLFGFKYSPRPCTPALRLGDDVAEEEKSARLAELFGLVESLRQKHLGQCVGTTQLVLVEGRGRNGRYTGRTERNEIVHFDADEPLAGQIVPVTIVRAFKNSLDAELPGSPRRGQSTPRHALPVLPC